jgi:hypothetical protein
MILFFNCENCGHNVEAHLSIYSGLGPPRRRCSKCGKPYYTGRQEWPTFSAGRRVWFIVYSFAAAAVVGGLAWGMAAATFGAIRDRSWEVDLGRYWVVGILAGTCWAGAILALQAFRKSSSVRRFQAGDKVYKGRFWNLQVEVELKVMVVLFASMALFALLGLVGRR